MGKGEVCHGLEFLAGGERKSWRVFTFLIFLYHRYMECIHSQALPLQSESSYVSASPASLPSSFNPPATKNVKIPQTHYLKSGRVGHFQHVNVYPIWISRFTFSFALICIFNTWPQAGSHLVHASAGVMMSHFRRTKTACCFLCFICWPTILIYWLPRGFICTWNAESISIYWLWIMTAKKEV